METGPAKEKAGAGGARAAVDIPVAVVVIPAGAAVTLAEVAGIRAVEVIHAAVDIQEQAEAIRLAATRIREVDRAAVAKAWLSSSQLRFVGRARCRYSRP